MHVVGLDMSTENNKQGVAVGKVDVSAGKIEVLAVGNGGKLEGFLDVYKPTLLAIDSPLGWPVCMRKALCNHRVGEKIDASRDRVFYRETDKFIKDKLCGINPFKVGADKIAQTAHAACELIGKGGTLNNGRGIPVLLSPRIPKGLSAIEVYPAATMFAHEWGKVEGYKGREASASEKRQCIVDKLSSEENFVFQNGTRSRAENNADILDACVCLLAARDFLRGECCEPKEAKAKDAVKVEGWIWVRRKQPRP